MIKDFFVRMFPLKKREKLSFTAKISKLTTYQINNINRTKQFDLLSFCLWKREPNGLLH